MASTATRPPLPRLSMRRQLDSELRVPAVVLLGALTLALLTHADHLQGIPGIVRATVASAVMFLICGDALAYAMVPVRWQAVRGLFALPLGAAANALVLTAFGVAHVPLRLSLWVTLALGLAASAAVRRRGFGAGPQAAPAQRRSWVAVLVVVFCVAVIPAGRTGADTIYGTNPDAHQVAGIAVLFEHVAPTGTDDALPIDTVPPAWRFRYPIFYPLAGAGNLAHDDPIRIFPAIAALLVVMAALGFAVLAVKCLGAPEAAGPAIAAVIGFSAVTLHLAWHPYWNQLWGFAMFPYALLFGWRALADRDARAGVLFALVLAMLGLAYPLALPYPVAIVGALGIAYWRRPRLPMRAGARAWIAGTVVLLALIPVLAGAAVKLGQGIGQLLTPGSALWGGDIHRLLPIGLFVGTGGGWVPALVVAALAALGLRALPRGPALAFGGVLLALCLLDLRFRLSRFGAYMDFKHLSFVGTLVLTLAASFVARLVCSGAPPPGDYSQRNRRQAIARRRSAAVGVGLLAVWGVAALVQDGGEGLGVPRQVTPELFAVRRWAARLPHGASVRVDIGPSGTQLWAVYMLGDHPVDAPRPVLATTYARASYGVRADYSLSLRYYPNGDVNIKRSYPVPAYAVGPPVFQNSAFVLRRIDWPARLAKVPDTASTKLVEP